MLSDEHLSFTFGVPLHVTCENGRYVIERVDKCSQ